MLFQLCVPAENVVTLFTLSVGIDRSEQTVSERTQRPRGYKTFFILVKSSQSTFFFQKYFYSLKHKMTSEEVEIESCSQDGYRNFIYIILWGKN